MWHTGLQFTALLRTELVQDMLFLFDAKQSIAYLVVDLGKDVCGHAKIVHGGLLSSICDETYGALVYCMKQENAIGPEPAVTANLNINYRKVRSCLHCSCTEHICSLVPDSSWWTPPPHLPKTDACWQSLCMLYASLATHG